MNIQMAQSIFIGYSSGQFLIDWKLRIYLLIQVMQFDKDIYESLLEYYLRKSMFYSFLRILMTKILLMQPLQLTLLK